MSFSEQAGSAAAAAAAASLDAFWQQAARVVSSGDLERYAAMYHPDAVLVVHRQTTNSDTAQGTTQPIQQALQEWKQGFDDTAAGRQKVHLRFRFGQRFRGPDTAHETGIFCYHCTKGNDSPPTTMYMHFESLLVNKPAMGGWLWLMEYQKQVASVEEWDALAPSRNEEN